MKNFKKICYLILISLILIVVNSNKTYAATNPYPKWQTIKGVKTIRCTFYAWQQVYNYTGIALPGFGNAKTWHIYAKKAGYSVGRVPKEKSIVVYTSGTYGHVAWVHNKYGNTGKFYIMQGGATINGEAAGGDRNIS